MEKNNSGDGLIDFYNFWFYGVGVTTQSGYYAMNNAAHVPHDYTVAYWQDIQNSADQLTNIGSILNDPGDYPYDEYEVTWIQACPGTCFRQRSLLRVYVSTGRNGHSSEAMPVYYSGVR